MIRNQEEFVEYLRDWGCPDDEIDEVIDLYFERDRNYPIKEDFMEEWLELMGYLEIEVRWHCV